MHHVVKVKHFSAIINDYHIKGIIGRESDHMRAICQCDGRSDYNSDQPAKSLLPVRGLGVEQPQASHIDSINPTSFWLHLLTLFLLHSFTGLPSIHLPAHSSVHLIYFFPTFPLAPFHQNYYITHPGNIH